MTMNKNIINDNCQLINGIIKHIFSGEFIVAHIFYSILVLIFFSKLNYKSFRKKNKPKIII